MPNYHIKPARPFVFINAAMSADGKIATREHRQTRISGSMDFDRMDELRASSDAIMVGIGTVLSDNPSLTVKSKERRDKRKEIGLLENPVRVVVDSKAKIPICSDIFKKGEGRRIIAVSSCANADKIIELSKYGEIIMAGHDRVNLESLLVQLRSMDIKRLMLEGGATLNWGMISKGLVDEIYTFMGNIVIGGKDAPTLVDGEGFSEDFPKLILKSCERLEDGILVIWKVQ